MADKPNTSVSIKEVAPERKGPLLTDRAIRIKSSLHSISTIVRDRETDWKKFLDEKQPGADAIKEEIKALFEVYETR